MKSRWKRKKIMKSFMTCFLGYEQEIHKKNQKRIRIGLRCLIIIPLIFLTLLFWTESSKIVFLILWIVSLFILAGYLIFVEYSDYKLQEKLNEISNREQQERDALIGDGIAQVEERIRTVLQTAEQELLTDSTKE